MLRLFILCLLVLARAFALNPLTSTDCELCIHLVQSQDTSKIMNAACKVVQAGHEVVDAEWKLHSSAMIAKDTEGEILKQIQHLSSNAGISPAMICGFMGVKSHQGGCVCPLNLAPFHRLGTTMSSLSSDHGGSSLSAIESALSCPATRDSVSLLELGRRTRIKKRRRTSSKTSLIMRFEGCDGNRGKGRKDDSPVDKVVREIRPNSDLTSKRADGVTGLVMGGIGIGIGAACPPCGVAFGIVWGMFNFIGNEFGEAYEREICEEIMEKAHRALSTKQPLRSSNEKVCVWDLMHRSPMWPKYVRAVHDLGDGTFVGDEAPIPDPLSRSSIKSTVNFLLNVVPKPSIAEHVTEVGAKVSIEVAQMLGETLFHESLESILSDKKAYRTATVMYMLQAFYAEALLRETRLEVKTHDWDRDHHTREHYFLNLDVFGRYLRDKLVFKLNAKRGTPGLHGLDLMCGMAGRPGKVGGCPIEYERLIKTFNDAQRAFVETYLWQSDRDSRLRGSAASTSSSA